jgi:ABC-2 type transport system permease protein
MNGRGIFAAFVRKEFCHIFRDVRTMLILLGMPVVQIVLFGFALSTEIRDARVAILAPVRDGAVRQLAERMDASPYFRVTAWLDSPAQADAALRTGTADLVMAFGARFADRLCESSEGAALQWIVDATDVNTAGVTVMYAGGILRTWLAEQPGWTPPAGAVPHVQMLYNPGMKSAYSFVPGVMGLILMLICAMMTSISIVREKETGTMEALLVSPVRPLYIVLAKMTPYALLSLVNFGTVLALSVFLLEVPMAGSLFWLTALSVVYVITGLALGLLISTLTHTQTAALLVSAGVLMLPVIMLSGMVFPIEGMPAPLRALSCLIPARWYIPAVKKLMIEGLPATYVLREACILTVMAVTLIVVSLRNFKIRLS